MQIVGRPLLVHFPIVQCVLCLFFIFVISKLYIIYFPNNFGYCSNINPEIINLPRAIHRRSWWQAWCLRSWSKWRGHRVLTRIVVPRGQAPDRLSPPCWTSRSSTGGRWWGCRGWTWPCWRCSRAGPSRWPRPEPWPRRPAGRRGSRPRRWRRCPAAASWTSTAGQPPSQPTQTRPEIVRN